MAEVKTIKSGESIRIDILKCPECGGFLRLSVDEWETNTGIPTNAGVLVECEAEWATEAPHSYLYMEWGPISYAAQEWARANLRVKL